MWQVAGGHGIIDPKAAIKEMFSYVDAGFTTWDLADIYGPAEDLIGEFRRQLLATHGKAALTSLQMFTKWVPRSTKMTKKLVEENINKSLTRMGVESIDLLQFHWWDYRNSNYLDALHIANVAVRYILDKPTVAGVIIGVRLGLSEHLQDNAKVFGFNLDTDDNEKIDEICRKSRDLYRIVGDCGDEYR
ncbi:unnamed protein product [Rotaria sordida]|uniref:NADP-dependent oxidoreductase domain-containing protein n=1 Tax=Rotaria sordida TaxID=392033 RepID=A0A819D2S5_9BILA|nr:unnamed protein product [Rotaria sordida]CAF3822065.1 unnamed protein product [Rotaria sordida]